jgi:hypothetical protein
MIQVVTKSTQNLASSLAGILRNLTSGSGENIENMWATVESNLNRVIKKKNFIYLIFFF